MNTFKARRILQDSGFTKENAESFVDAINEHDNVATKSDIKDLEIRMLGEFKKVSDDFSKVYQALNSMTWKFLGGIALLGVIFKFADYLIHKGVL